MYNIYKLCATNKVAIIEQKLSFNKVIKINEQSSLQFEASMI